MIIHCLFYANLVAASSKIDVASRFKELTLSDSPRSDVSTAANSASRLTPNDRDSPRSDVSTADSETSRRSTSCASPGAEKVYKKLGSPNRLLSQINTLDPDTLKNIVNIETHQEDDIDVIENFAQNHPDLFSTFLENKLKKNQGLTCRANRGKKAWKQKLHSVKMGRHGSGFKLLFSDGDFFIDMDWQKSGQEVEINVAAVFGPWEEQCVYPEEMIVEMLTVKQEFKAALNEAETLKITGKNIVNGLSRFVTEKVKNNELRKEFLLAMPVATVPLNISLLLNSTNASKFLYDRIEYDDTKYMTTIFKRQ